MDIQQIKAACSTCSLRELCLPLGLNSEEFESLDKLVKQRRKIKRGDYLHRTGLRFSSLYAIRNGFFKTYLLHEDGREQVTGFHMTGELLGLDAISSDVHTCNAIALEDSEVCEMPFAKLEEISRAVPVVMRNFHKIMSREIVRDHGVMLLLGNMNAEERLAVFLLNLSHRFAARGLSPNDFKLRMTREEIGAYLGLKLETISRTFSKFQEEGLMEVSNKHIQLLKLDALKKVVGNDTSCR